MPSSSIPALSVRQPWAELIISGRKTIEIRSWATDYRGTLWLHTGTTVDGRVAHATGLVDLFTGGYIGAVELVAIVSLDLARWEQWQRKHFIGGPLPRGHFAWILEAPRRLSMPIKAPGQLGLFRPAESIVDQIVRQLGDSEESD